MNTATPNAPTRLLRIREVARRTGLGVSTIYDLCAKGLLPRSFPHPLNVRASVWLESEIEKFLQERIEQTRQAAE